MAEYIGIDGRVVVTDMRGRERETTVRHILEMNKGVYTAADVRPVVYCKDCVHYEMGVCLKIYDDGAANKDAWQERKPDDFCSYGEKREES